MTQALIKNFFETHLPEKPPLLLGLSGGPDSMALFHLLVEVAYHFEVAHVDHGWREESREESLYLEKLCQEAGVPFHLKRLRVPEEKKNLEDQGRRERLAFFKGVVAERKLQGVLLAHHADDQAETVLKRVFEGASLPKLKGLVPLAEWEGLKIYRPFLKLKKGEILEWLQARNLAYFQDATNRDPRFLRSRMRLELMPLLSDKFGKEVSSNLCRLGEAAAELEAFLNELAQPYLEQIQVTGESIGLDFSDQTPPSEFLWKAVLKKFFNKAQLTVSASLLNDILAHLQKGSCHKKMKIGERDLLIHKRGLKIK